MCVCGTVLISLFPGPYKVFFLIFGFRLKCVSVSDYYKPFLVTLTSFFLEIVGFCSKMCVRSEFISVQYCLSDIVCIYSYIFLPLINAFTKPSILGEVETRIYLGSVLFILKYIMRIYSYIFFTLYKRIYKAIYFRGS